MTALALIFAVFLTNPSPICILDEVDALLDDTNVARFCDMLGQIAEETGTFYRCDTPPSDHGKNGCLYGVTMEQKKGVSRVVSVDLQTAERFKKLRNSPYADKKPVHAECIQWDTMPHLIIVVTLIKT